MAAAKLLALSGIVNQLLRSVAASLLATGYGLPASKNNFG